MLAGLVERRRRIRELLDMMVKSETFSMGAIKKAVSNFVLDRNLDSAESVGMLKADGMIVEEMYAVGSEVFECGEEELPAGSSNLKVNEMVKLHRESCVICTDGLSEGCRFWRMSRCISHGWKVPVEAEFVKRKYKHNGNYPSAELYSESFEDEISRMREGGVIRVASSTMVGITSPMSAVVKKSDILRAKTLVQVDIGDQYSLKEANEKLLSRQEKKVKTRTAVDLTATGINGAAPKPPFRYPSIQDGLKLVRRNCWLGKTDLERYFFAFPLAKESYPWFMIAWCGILYYFVRAMFGFSTCPYYCSTWSAEFAKWINNKGIKAAHMVDDWLVSGDTREEVKSKLNALTAIFVLVGFSVAVEKEEIGQRLAFLGILIDTIRMVLSFDAVVARSMHLQLSEYVTLIEQGRDLDETTIRSVAGRLQWYSEVLQSGKVHLRSWWLYLKYRSKLNPRIRYKLVLDSKWWLTILETWAAGHSNDIEYPITSAAELKSDPCFMDVVSSDASGPDGFGYIYGHREDDDPAFFCKKWDKDYSFVTSHTGEMQALRHYLKYRHGQGSKILVWLTDSLSAMWSVNKGRCKEESGLVILEDILTMCDIYRVQLIALWVPREENILCDYLSHLSVVMDRDEHSGGSVRHLCLSKDYGGKGGAAKMVTRDKANRRTLQKLVYRPGVEFVPSISI